MLVAKQGVQKQLVPILEKLDILVCIADLWNHSLMHKWARAKMKTTEEI